MNQTESFAFEFKDKEILSYKDIISLVVIKYHNRKIKPYKANKYRFQILQSFV